MREGCRASGGSREGHVGVLPTCKPNFALPLPAPASWGSRLFEPFCFPDPGIYDAVVRNDVERHGGETLPNQAALTRPPPPQGCYQVAHDNLDGFWET